MDQDVDILGEAVDEAMALGEGGAALELKTKAELLQSPKCVHDPIVLLDEPGIDRKIPGRHGDQVGEVERVVEEHQVGRGSGR